MLWRSWGKSYFCRWFHVKRSCIWSWPFLFYFSSARRGNDVKTFKWWKLNWKESRFTLQLREWQDIWVVCWMFQINKVFFYAIFPRSVYYWICFRRLPQVAAIKTLVQLLLISRISWSSLSCFGFDLTQSQGTKPIWLWPGLIKIELGNNEQGINIFSIH